MIPQRTPQRGVTLIELMVVVGIIAVFAALMFSVNTQTYGASAMNVADQVASDFNLCKMRAVSTRRWHRCEITATYPQTETSPTTLTIMQWQDTGMRVPTTGTWYVVQEDRLGTGVQVWDANTTVCASSPCSAAPTAPTSSLTFDIDFRPDGSSTGGTVYLTQPNRSKSYRVVVYKATGSSYARNSW